MEAPPGFEPGMEVLQTSALPLGDGAVRAECEDPGKKKWSGKRDSNPRLRPWQGRTLPLSYSRSSNFENYGNTRLQPSSRRLAVPALTRPRHQMGRLRRYAELFGVSRRVRPSSKTTRGHEGVDHDFHPRPPVAHRDRHDVKPTGDSRSVRPGQIVQRHQRQLPLLGGCHGGKRPSEPTRRTCLDLDEDENRTM